MFPKKAVVQEKTEKVEIRQYTQRTGKYEKPDENISESETL